MKHLSYSVALAALLMFASCQKEDTPTESPVKEDPVFTATIANDATKTSLSGKSISWTMSDEITITDSETSPNTVKYEVNAIDTKTGKATFTKKSGESGTLGSGPYTATYGEAPSTSQTYTATDGVQNVTNLPMSAISETTNLTFTVSCGLLKVTLTQTGISISSIAVSDGTSTYTLTCSDAVSIASGATFYIAVPAGTYTSFKFTESNGYVSWRSPLTIAVEANHIKPVSSNFGPEYKENETLYGYGSKINGSWWAPVNCGYEPATATSNGYPYGKLYQWGRIDGHGYDENDATYPSEDDESLSSDPVDLDCLESGVFYYSHGNWYDGEDPSPDELWGEIKTDYDPCPEGWRVPTGDEFDKIVIIGGSAWGTSTVGTVEQYGCWFSGSSEASEGTGVFFPAAGYRSGEDGKANDRGTYGYYWSSSVSDNEVEETYSMYMYMEDVVGVSTDGAIRSNGYSVRCVKKIIMP